MDAPSSSAENAVSAVAAAIGEPARARMLCCLMDSHARTSTELAIVAEISPSTASMHLARLKDQRLVRVLAQGKHRYYSLEDAGVAAALEALMVVAGVARTEFVPNTPVRLRFARACYDHIAGRLGVALHDRFHELRWLTNGADETSYSLTEAGVKAFTALGMDVPAIRAQRRRFACACLDWSERRPHLGGALAAAVLALAMKKKWLACDLDSRALTVTRTGQRELRARFGLTERYFV